MRFWAAWTGIRASASRASSTRVADLEQVAHDDRDAEAVADVAAAAERERDGEARVVDPVEQAPQAVAHPEHPAAAPLGQVDDALEARDRVVVVAHEHRRVARPRALRAADDEARRPVEREQPRGQLVAAGELDEPLVGRDELGHVAGERAPAGVEVGPVGAAVLEVPRPVGRPHRVEARLPLRPGRELLDRLELELLRAAPAGCAGSSLSSSAASSQTGRQ